MRAALVAVVVVVLVVLAMGYVSNLPDGPRCSKTIDCVVKP